MRGRRVVRRGVLVRESAWVRVDGLIHTEGNEWGVEAEEHEYLATTNDCLPAREQGSGAGSCVSSAGAGHLLPEWGSGQSIIHS